MKKYNIPKEKVFLSIFIISLIAIVISALYYKSLAGTVFFIGTMLFSGYLNQPYLKKIFYENEEKPIEKPQDDSLLMDTKRKKLNEFLETEKLDSYYLEYQNLFNENKYIMSEIYEQLFSKRFAYAKNFFKLPFKFDHALKRTLDISKSDKIKLDYEYYKNTLAADIFIFTKNKYEDCEKLAAELAKILLFEDKDIVEYLIKNTINTINLNFENQKFSLPEDIIDIESIFSSYFFAKIIVRIFNILSHAKNELSKNSEFLPFLTTAVAEYKEYKKTIEYINDTYQEKYKELINEEQLKLLTYLLCLDYNAKIIDSGYDLDIARIIYKYDPLFSSLKPLNVSTQALTMLEPYKQFAEPSSFYLKIKYGELIAYVIENEKVTPAMIQKEFHISYDEGVYLVNHLEELQIIAPGDYIKGREILVTSIPENINKEENVIKNHFINYLFNLNLTIPETIYNTLIDITHKEENKNIILHNQNSIISKILYCYLPNKKLENQLLAIESSNYWNSIINYLLKDYPKK